MNLSADDTRAAPEGGRQRFEPLRNRPDGIRTGQTVVLWGDRRTGDQAREFPFPASMNEQIDSPDRFSFLPGQQGASILSISAPSARNRTSICSYPRSICPML